MPDSSVTSALNANAVASGAATLDKLALTTPTGVVYSDFNWLISTFLTPTTLPGEEFPLNIERYGSPVSAFEYIENHESIKGSIHNIIYTKPGERVMTPAFGIPLNDLLFENLTETIIAKLHFLVQDAFSKWDPRLSVAGVDVDQRGNVADITVTVSVVGIPETVPIVFRNIRGTM